MNPVGEGGNKSSVTAPASVTDVPPAIAGMEPINQPDNSAAPKIPGTDPILAEAKLKMTEKRFTDVAEQAIPTIDAKEDSTKAFLDQFKLSDPSQIGEEPKITLSPESPTLTNVNQPPAEASSDAASPNPVTLNDLLTKGPQAAFDEPVQAVSPINEPVSQQGDLQTNIGNTIPAAEVVQQAEKTPKEEIMEEFSKILDNYSVEKATEKVPA
jgi:hypothetical protein